jgi:hypothetical protein
MLDKDGILDRYCLIRINNGEWICSITCDLKEEPLSRGSALIYLLDTKIVTAEEINKINIRRL